MSGPEADTRDRVMGFRVRWDRAERALCYVRWRRSAREPKLGNRRIIRLVVHEESDGAGAIIIRGLSRSMEAWCVARGAWCWVVGFAAPVKTNSGLGHGWDSRLAVFQNPFTLFEAVKSRSVGIAQIS